MVCGLLVLVVIFAARVVVVVSGTWAVVVLVVAGVTIVVTADVSVDMVGVLQPASDSSSASARSVATALFMNPSSPQK